MFTSGSFWLHFAINEVIALTGAYIAGSKLSDAKKAAAENLIQAAQAFINTP